MIETEFVFATVVRGHPSLHLPARRRESGPGDFFIIDLLESMA